MERSRTMRAIRGHNNKTTERRLRMALVRAGLRGWTLRPRRFPGNPDFVFTTERLAIFVDGCFWHGCPACHRTPKTNIEFWIAKIERNRLKDARMSEQLSECGYSVIRLWEHDLR